MSMCWRLQGQRGRETVSAHVRMMTLLSLLLLWGWKSNLRNLPTLGAALPPMRPPHPFCYVFFFFLNVENLPTTPNTFLMSGTYIASKTMMMLSANVVRECRIQENGQFEKSIIIKAFLACIAGKKLRQRERRKGRVFAQRNMCIVTIIFLPQTIHIPQTQHKLSLCGVFIHINLSE